MRIWRRYWNRQKKSRDLAKAEEAKPHNNSLVAVLVAAWAVVLLFAFLANRGDDVGRIGQLIGNLGGGAVFGSGIVDSFVGAVVAALILLSWYGMGSGITSSIRMDQNESHSHVLELVIKIAVGAATWSLFWFVIGLVSDYSKLMACLMLAIGLAGAFSWLRRLRSIKEKSRVPEPAKIFDKVVMFLAAVPIVLSFIASLAPPTAKDTLLYHFSVPKQFIAQGGNAVIEGNIASYLALGTEMHVVWAMLLGNIVSERAAEAAAGATVWLFFPLLLAAVFGIAREAGISRRWSLMAVLMAATVPTAYHVAASAYIDVALALYVLLATYSLTRWWKTLEKTWLILMAIFLGAALSAKLTTLFVMAAFALVILFKARNNPVTTVPGSDMASKATTGKIAAFGFGAFLLAGVIASPWYLRTWAETGSPIFPFYMSIWEGKAPGWDVDRSNLFQLMNSQYGGADKTVVDYLIAPWNISVTAQPEIAANFDGVLGVAFLIGLPLLIFALWKLDLRVEAKIFSGVALVMFLFWLFSSQQLRYLLPILPLLAIAIAAAVESMSDRRDILNKAAKFSIGFAAIACIATSAAWFLQKAPLRVVLGGETQDEYLARNLDYYPYYQWLNSESSADAKVWLINMRRDSYHLDRPYFSDYLFEDLTLKELLWASDSARDMRDAAAKRGFNFILVRHDFLLDQKRSSVLDDTRTEQENRAKFRVLQEFISDKQNTVRTDNKFSLIKVF